MKRCEKMSKEEIMDFLINDNCSTCEVNNNYCRRNNGFSCPVTKKMYLNEEIPSKPRYEIYKTTEEARKAYEEFCHRRICSECIYARKHSKDINCKFKWLYDTEEMKE